MELLANVRQDFPILSRTVYNRPLVYLDNAATTQKPLCVLDAMREEYLNVNANVHRGVHFLSQQATDLHEAARERVRRFIHARSTAEVVFTRGTTESLNLVAASYGEAFLHEGDEVILTVMEHHSDIVPWQLLRDRKGIVLKVVPMTDSGELDQEAYRQLFTPRTRLVCCAHVSNVLGTVNPVKQMIATAHSHGVPVLVDGAQASPHLRINVRDLDADFYVFSSHKMYGPAGVGILYGKRELLEKMPPYQGGGEMISHVTFQHTTYAELPFKFEAGTPDFVDIAAFDKALDFIAETGMANIEVQEHELLVAATAGLAEIPGLTIYGTSDHKSAVISFNVEGIHNYDLGMLLDKQGVAVRTGHHCAQPLMERLGVPGTVRASFAVYNTLAEVDVFLAALRRAVEIFR